jgi:CHAT domain-containing protein/tetratricopeptide (TPR) repeat protein
MPKKRAVSWFLMSMMPLWVGLALAKPPEMECARTDQEELRGVVVEEVPKGSALAKAGLQAGDVILNWERLPNPPGNPEAASGNLESPFDWMWLEIEQAPRGVIKLLGRRGEEPIELQVSPGLWRLKPQPVLVNRKDGKRVYASELVDQLDLQTITSAWCGKNSHLPFGEVSLLRAWLLTQAGQHLAKAKRWDDAEACYRAATSGELPLRATLYIWLLLGQLYERSGAADQSASLYEQAANLASSNTGLELYSAKFISELQGLLYLRGEFPKAKDLAQRAHGIHERLAPGSLSHAESFSDLGSIVWKTGDLQLAEQLHAQALAIRSAQAPGTLWHVESLNDSAILSRDLGNQDRARALLEQSLSILRNLPGTDRPTAVVLGNLGNIALDQGDLRLAEGYYLHLLSLGRTHKDPTGQNLVGAALGNLGVISSLRGDLEMAENYYTQHLALSRETAPDSLEVAQALTNLGSLAKDRGDLQTALDYLHEGLAIKKRFAPESLALAGSLQNIGSVLRKQQRLEEAQSYYTSAWEMRRKLSDNNLHLAASLRNLGYVARDAGAIPMARKYFEEALDIQKEHAVGGIEMALTMSALGELSAHAGSLHEAIRYHESALSIIRSASPGSFHEASSLFYLARVHLKLGEERESFDLMRRALRSLQEQTVRIGGLAETKGQFHASVSDIFRFAVQLAVQLREDLWGFSSLEQFRARGFLAQLGEKDLDLTRDIPPALESKRARLAVELDRVASDFHLPNTVPRSGAGEELSARQRRLKREWNEVTLSIRQACPRLASLQSTEPIDVSGAKSALDIGTVLLSYLAGEKESVLFILSRDDYFRAQTLPIGGKELRQRVERFRRLMAEARPGTALGELRMAEMRRLGKELYTLLVAPVADRIARAERVLIVADGPLHYLPFAALVREAPGAEGREQHLVDWKPFHSVLSATVYAELRKGRHDPTAQAGNPLLLAAFADPQFPPGIEERKPERISDIRVRSAVRRGTLRFEPLPFTRREVEGIATLFPPERVRTFLGADATEERAKSIGEGARILHFAAHARLDDRFPLNSALVLSIPEGFPEDRDNGLLQVWEIFERVRLNADLVVLSACDTGLGEELGGEGLIGLTRAFQYAGTRTVMASLWSVQDQATSELMIRFYKHLRAGLTKDRALQAAQQELIRGPIEVMNDKGERVVKDFGAPYYWAGFQLYGDWQ